MKRREFIKNSSVVSVALPTFLSGCAMQREKVPFFLTQSLSLKGFDDEQEESPSLVTDGKGNLWMFALRRLSYPEDAEIVSAFHYDGKNWIETDPVTRSVGQYEAITASCALADSPVVAWTEKKGEEWIIRTAHMEMEKFGEPFTFPVRSGRSINPVLTSPAKGRHWIAWENLHQEKFTIHISKYENGQWSVPVIIDRKENSCFDPAIAEDKDGSLYVAYGLTDGFHQNIEMTVIDGKTLQPKKSVAVAVGGGHKNRVNINAKPALAFDAKDRLWISYENNRNAHRLDDGDNYTGDRICAIVSYQKGKIVEVEDTGKWLFKDKNDHRPTFVKDSQGHLFLATHCGGDFEGNPYWKYRLSWLDPELGWQVPITLLETKVKGSLIAPTIAFDGKGNFWFSTCIEKTFQNREEGITRSRLSELSIMQFTAPDLSENYKPISFKETPTEEYRPDEQLIGSLSGHPKMKRRQKTINGETYTLLYGNLHEHSNSSDCWPAGTDGTLDEDYRFGMFSEGYDFVGITDHASSTTEVYWRKSIRLADFYNEPEQFVAVPAIEWTLQSDPELDDIQHGAGHYNIIFATSEDARKYVRNKHEIYCPRTSESSLSPKLWKMLEEKEIDCVTIPHHPADEVHPMDWRVTHPRYVPAVEIFQCRGNNEYPGCPREKNLDRHNTTSHRHAFIDYALKEKKYKLGFIASGDHNSMGVGAAALWVKEVSRAGIIEALQNRRTFATTGDKIYIDLEINDIRSGETLVIDKVPELRIHVQGQYPLEKVEILRNSQVIHQFETTDVYEFIETFSDEGYDEEQGVLYYYLRATQKNRALAWSSPIWLELG